MSEKKVCVNVTRAALPQLRAQRSGLVMTISSAAGIAVAGDFLTAYAASKFGVEGFMEDLGSVQPNSTKPPRQRPAGPPARTEGEENPDG